MILTYVSVWALCLLHVGLGRKLEDTNSGSGKYKFCPEFPHVPNGSVVQHTDSHQYVVIKCDPGFKLRGGMDQYKCDYVTGRWKNLDETSPPECVKANSLCGRPHFQHAFFSTDVWQQVIFCYNGYSVRTQTGKMKSSQVECRDGKWYYRDTSEEVKDCVKDILCGQPPAVRHAAIKDLTQMEMFSPMNYRDGDKVYYQCNDGYQMFTNTNYVTCSNGEWVGATPLCIENKGCMRPPDISHANWRMAESSYFVEYNMVFPVGTRVIYSCMNTYARQYTLIGDSEIQCESSGHWTPAPMCVNPHDPAYCEIPTMDNGECICYAGEDECRRLTRGNKIECSCNHGYVTSGEEILTCLGNTWNHYTPKCQVKADPISADDMNDEERGHMNTLAIVVATACSVLGLLLLVMVIVVFRRRKPHHHHSRLYHQGVHAPPYQRVNSNPLTVDEHDRVALIGYESARLPTYEEATRSNSRSAGENSGRTSMAGSDYRPLPNIPTNILSNIQSHNNNNNNTLDNTSRHSVITTSTVNRDGVSEIFGSIDTVNFSTCTSDASTSVTVDTLESRASRPSNASGMATAGSLEASRENLSSDDVPLLGNSDQESVEMDHSEMTPSDPEICSESEDKENV